MSVESLEELFLDELKDLYSAEKQITKALPNMVKAATSPELKDEEEAADKKLTQIAKEVNVAALNGSPMEDE